jgi:dipeptide transport system permease protein
MSDFAVAPPMRATIFWSNFSRNRSAVVGLAVLVALISVALLAGFIAPHDPIQQYRSSILSPPAWMAGGDSRFLLGTDDIGRDMLSRLIHGARLSLLLGIAIVALALIVGCSIGLIAAFAGGVIDAALMRTIDIILVLPGLVLAVIIVAIAGPGLTSAIIAITIVTMPGFARQTRAAVLREMSREYYDASRCAGAGFLHLALWTVVPNCLSPIIIQATLSIATAILDAAALGFLGLGVQPPTPEWGTMLSGSLSFLQSAWWMVTFPGACILFTVVAFNLVGDGLRDALDPKLRRA